VDPKIDAFKQELEQRTKKFLEEEKKQREMSPQEELDPNLDPNRVAFKVKDVKNSDSEDEEEKGTQGKKEGQFHAPIADDEDSTPKRKTQKILMTLSH